MPVPDLTVDELVDMLRHSDLPTVIVEGKDDIRIYRWIEARLGSHNANVHPAGGRNNLLSVYERRQEFAKLPVAFVADKDMWLFSEIPSVYSDIIWTEGYSIENDLYLDADLETLLDPEERKRHQQFLDVIFEWFASEVEECLAGRPFEIDHHCDEVVPLGQTTLREKFRKRLNFRPPSAETLRQIKSEYKLKLRGKLLFQVLERFLKARKPHTQYNIYSLHEIAVKYSSNHPLMSRLMQEIEQTIAEQKSALRDDKLSL